jgi:hypothetical protein
MRLAMILAAEQIGLLIVDLMLAMLWAGLI